MRDVPNIAPAYDLIPSGHPHIFEEPCSPALAEIFCGQLI